MTGDDEHKAVTTGTQRDHFPIVSCHFPIIIWLRLLPLVTNSDLSTNNVETWNKHAFIKRRVLTFQMTLEKWQMTIGK
jgi:hypothetical protein